MTSLFRKLNNRKRRVLVIGLDCASPDLIFTQFNRDLPNLSRLMSNGTWGVLNSCIPCITVPAWASMMSSRDPGELGVYGFRNRVDTGYSKMAVASGADIKVKRVWDILSEANKSSLVMGVPQTYPVKPLNGHLIAGFPAADLNTVFTYPAIFKSEVLKVAPHYPFDVVNFRTDDKADLLQRIIDFTDTQYTVLEQMLTHKPWDFAMHVNMGVDRIHHGFWRYHDPQHRLYTAGNSFEHAIHDYYGMVDRWIGRLLEKVGDDTTVLVVSDHGIKRMDGGVCINEWLWRNGWLYFKTPPKEGEITPFDENNVDWSRTRAWGSGGYYGRVSLNVAGREPQGIVTQSAYESTRDELAAALCAIPDHESKPLNTRVYKPQQIYRQVNGIAPDLLVYFGDLHWRSVGSLGHGAYTTFDNDTGPDDANHAVEGMFIWHDPKARGSGQLQPRQLMDIAPTILNHIGVAIPPTMQGKSLI